jgi:hypothetical protein
MTNIIDQKRPQIYLPHQFILDLNIIGKAIPIDFVDIQALR